MKNKVKFETEGEAIMAYKKAFGFIPWGLGTGGEEHTIAVVEKAIEENKPWKPKAPEGCVY